jgi:hypothetical protein
MDMKKLFFLGLLFCLLASLRSAFMDINVIRSLYQKAVTNEQYCKQLIEATAAYNENNNPLMLGYKASGTMIMAKHVFNPFTKMSYFKKGKDMLEKAIESDKNNIELRFLRFAAQTNMPSFLGYNKSIQNDKKFLLTSFSQIKDIRLKELLLPVLHESKYVTAEEKQQMY